MAFTINVNGNTHNVDVGHMLASGRVLFGQMDEVVFGKSAAEAIAAQVPTPKGHSCLPDGEQLAQSKD